MARKIVIAILIVVALVGAGLVLFISAPQNQRVVTDRVIGAIAGPGQEIAVREVGGKWPSHIIWSGITVSDREGVWLTLDRLELRLNLAALLTARLDIESARVTAAHVTRQPVGDPNRPPSPPPTIDGMTRALGRVTVRDMRIDALRLEPPVIGREIDAVLVGSLMMDPASKLHTLSLDGRQRDGSGSVAVKVAAGRNAAVVQVNAAAQTITATGAITINNRSNALSGALKLNCRGENACFAWPSGRVGVVTADLALAGTLLAPEGQVDFQAQDLALGVRKVNTFTGRISARRKADAPAGVIAITGAGGASGLSAGLPEARPLIGDTGKWSFTLTRSPDGVLVLDAGAVEAGDLSASVAGLGLMPALTPADVRLTLTGGGRLLGLADSASRTDANLRIDRLEEGGRGSGHLSLVLKGLPPSANIRPLLQTDLSLEADIAAAADRVSFTNIAARSGETTVRGASAWVRAPRFDHASSTLTLTLPRAAAVLPELTQADVTLKGPLARLHANISATAPIVLLSRAPVRDAVVSAAVDRTADSLTVKMDGTGQWVDGPLTFAATLSQVQKGLIQIGAIRWKTPSTDFTGDLQLSTASGLLTGELRGPITDLVPLTTAFGAASAGRADVTASLSGVKTQRLDLRLSARDVQNAALAAETLTFTGRLEDLFGDMRISTRAEGAGARLFDRPLASFVTRAEGDLKSLKIAMDAKGAGDTPFSLSSATEVAFGASTVITFQKLAGRDGDLDVTLLAPSQLTLSETAMTLASTRVSVKGGELEAGFTWNKTNDTFDGALHARKVALPAFTAIPGQTTSVVVSGDLALSGPMTSVGGAGRLTGTLPGAKGQPPIDLTASVNLSNGRARIEATAGGLSREPAVLTADLPARLNLAAARFALSTAEPASGTLKWTGSLTPLWRLIPADVNVLAGDVVIDAALSGTLAAPVIAGSFKLINGTYENLVGGTALRNIEASIGGDGGGGFTLAMKAQDMNDGTVSLSGRVANDRNLTADVTAEMARLDVVHRDDVIAAATGKLTYTGPLGAGVIKGDVEIVNSLVRLGGSYMPQIPLLRALPGFEPVRNDGMVSGIALEIAVNTSNPMRIEGQGLDSQWRGQMNVAGSLAVPDVRGTLTLDRGSFSFLGQTFTLDSGTVTFTGGGTIDPQLNIVAVREASDITATVNITGRARAPDVELTSRPALPRDEILARLLFRKGTGELGPIESIQLASAASDLAGISDGGINGVLRRTLGIDVSSGAEGNSVMVGRQIGRNLYVSVGQSLTEQEREIVVEWRISRSFSLKSTTSDVTGADIGVFWRKDY